IRLLDADQRQVHGQTAGFPDGRAVPAVDYRLVKRLLDGLPLFVGNVETAERGVEEAFKVDQVVRTAEKPGGLEVVRLAACPGQIRPGVELLGGGARAELVRDSACERVHACHEGADLAQVGQRQGGGVCAHVGHLGGVGINDDLARALDSAVAVVDDM